MLDLNPERHVGYCGAKESLGGFGNPWSDTGILVSRNAKSATCKLAIWGIPVEANYLNLNDGGSDTA